MPRVDRPQPPGNAAWATGAHVVCQNPGPAAVSNAAIARLWSLMPIGTPVAIL